MLGGMFKYGGIVAKTKAIQSQQMKEEDFAQLMQKNTLAEVVAFLKNHTHYADIFKDTPEKDLHRGDIENPLKQYYASILKKYYTFITGDDRQVIEAIFIKEEIEAIKDILRRIEGDKDLFISPVDAYIASHFSVDLKKLSASADLKEFLSNISGSRYERIIRLYLHSDIAQSMFSIEMALDSFYFKLMFRWAKKSLNQQNRRIIGELIGRQIDMANIMWIYRSKQYYEVPKEIVFAHLIPERYKLTRQALQEMTAAESLPALVELIEATEYRELVRGLDESKGIFIERKYEMIYTKNLKRIQKENPFSIAAVIAQLHLANIEISKIISIVECIRYEMHVDEIKQILGEIS